MAPINFVMKKKIGNAEFGRCGTQKMMYIASGMSGGGVGVNVEAFELAKLHECELVHLENPLTKKEVEITFGELRDLIDAAGEPFTGKVPGTLYWKLEADVFDMTSDPFGEPFEEVFGDSPDEVEYLPVDEFRKLLKAKGDPQLTTIIKKLAGLNDGSFIAYHSPGESPKRLI